MRRKLGVLVYVLLYIPFLAWQLYEALTTPVAYKALLIFMVDDEKESKSGGSITNISIHGSSV